VRNVKPVYVKTGRVMALGPLDMIARVILPAALPEIFAGLRIGFSLTLIGTLLGEMFASQRGLGFLLMSAIGLHNLDLIMTLTLLLSLFAGAASVALLALNRRLDPRS
jgi:NitT/TauT family transport system permease protein